jgi:hypothetical protein
LKFSIAFTASGGQFFPRSRGLKLLARCFGNLDGTVVGTNHPLHTIILARLSRNDFGQGKKLKRER